MPSAAYAGTPTRSAPRKYIMPKRRGIGPSSCFWNFPLASVELFTGGKNMLPSPPDPIGYIHFCLVLDNLEQALDHLAKMNVKPERKFIGRAKQRIAFVSDPDGNSIELMEIPPESEIYRPYP
jgi:catechol 2,3-dioxygenase-like lactoylglutathione lyase family enzyme